MKYVRILGLAAMALAALMAMAGTASATTLTAPHGTTYTGTIKATSTHVNLTSVFGGFGAVTCKHSLIEGVVEKHGVGQTVVGKINVLTFTECTGGTPTDPVGVAAGSGKRGSLELHHIAGTPDGTLTSLGAEVVIHGTAFGTCTFTTPSTGRHIGRLTGTTTTKTEHAVFHIENAKIDSPCGTGTWEGTYTVLTPTGLNVDA